MHITPPSKRRALLAILRAIPGNSGQAQRQRIMTALAELGNITTPEAVRWLDSPRPGARISELRSAGNQIITTGEKTLPKQESPTASRCMPIKAKAMTAYTIRRQQALADLQADIRNEDAELLHLQKRCARIGFIARLTTNGGVLMTGPGRTFHCSDLTEASQRITRLMHKPATSIALPATAFPNSNAEKMANVPPNMPQKCHGYPPTPLRNQ